MSINFFKTSSLGLIFILCGCNSLHFYDESASKMASNAKNSYAESNIIDALKVERKNFETIEKNEEKAYLRIENANRDLTLLSILKSENFFKSFDDYFYKKISLMILKETCKKNDGICIETCKKNHIDCIYFSDNNELDQIFKNQQKLFNDAIINFDMLKNIEQA